MSLNLRIALTSLAVCAVLGSSAANGQNTVLKLSLGNTGPDLAMNGSGVLGTTSDGDAGTTGDQNTAIEYTGILDSLFTDTTGSFSVAGLQTSGPPNIIAGTVIVQDFVNGAFDLYDSANSLLLHGDLTESTLTGVIGSTGTGSIFTTKVGNFTGGSLLPAFVPNSLGLSMALTNVNGGNGFLVSGSPFTLQSFATDASVNISAEGGVGIPEPASIAIALLGAVGFSLVGRRRA
jgi:hypothetical protein